MKTKICKSNVFVLPVLSWLCVSGGKQIDLHGETQTLRSCFLLKPARKKKKKKKNLIFEVGCLSHVLLSVFG